MTSRNYGDQLRQLRALELRTQKDLTEQAMTVYNLRSQTITDSDKSPEVKEREHAAAVRQWDTFMQRPMPANG